MAEPSTGSMRATRPSGEAAPQPQQQPVKQPALTLTMAPQQVQVPSQARPTQRSQARPAGQQAAAQATPRSWWQQPQYLVVGLLVLAIAELAGYSVLGAMWLGVANLGLLAAAVALVFAWRTRRGRAVLGRAFGNSRGRSGPARSGMGSGSGRSGSGRGFGLGRIFGRSGSQSGSGRSGPGRSGSQSGPGRFGLGRIFGRSGSRSGMGSGPGRSGSGRGGLGRIFGGGSGSRSGGSGSGRGRSGSNGGGRGQSGPMFGRTRDLVDWWDKRRGNSSRRGKNGQPANRTGQQASNPAAAGTAPASGGAANNRTGTQSGTATGATQPTSRAKQVADWYRNRKEEMDQRAAAAAQQAAAQQQAEPAVLPRPRSAAQKAAAANRERQQSAAPSSSQGQQHQQVEQERGGSKMTQPTVGRHAKPSAAVPSGGRGSFGTNDDIALQTWGTGLSAAGPAAEEVAAAVRKAEVAAEEARAAMAAYRSAMANAADQGDDSPASAVMRGAVHGVADSARAAQTSQQWMGVADEADTLPSVYITEHGNDQDRWDDPRFKEHKADFNAAAADM